MDAEKQLAFMIEEYGGSIQLKSIPKPEPKQGELLIKVDASTINPSDLIFLSGNYFKRPLPSVCGIEGTGYVVAAKDEQLKSWVGKRVCFVSMYGSWCQYSVASAASTFEITEDIDIQTAASGIVNPLTVIGFVQTFKNKGYKGGIIHTAGASNLGKMLNRICKTENIPLLGIVRRQEAADAMLKQGISDVIVTAEEGWQAKLKDLVKDKGYDCLFDALGGGPVLDSIFSSIKPTSGIYVYGALESKPLTITDNTLVFQGFKLEGFLVFPWWMTVDPETQKKVRDNYTTYLKTDLSSKNGFTVSLKDIKEGSNNGLVEALNFARKNTLEGKVLIDFRQ